MLDDKITKELTTSEKLSYKPQLLRKKPQTKMSIIPGIDQLFLLCSLSIKHCLGQQPVRAHLPSCSGGPGLIPSHWSLHPKAQQKQLINDIKGSADTNSSWWAYTASTSASQEQNVLSL